MPLPLALIPFPPTTMDLMWLRNKVLSCLVLFHSIKLLRYGDLSFIAGGMTRSFPIVENSQTAASMLIFYKDSFQLSPISPHKDGKSSLHLFSFQIFRNQIV